MKIRKPSYGETRTITKFAFRPITINNETRLWETVTIKQYYCSLGWKNVKFIDKIYDEGLNDFLNYID